MNKTDLIEALAPRLGGRTEAATAVEALVDVILREVAAGGSVGVTGFGVFERVDRAARTGRNPRTGEAVPISPTSTPRFRPATYFKDVVADPSTLPTDGLAGVRVGTQEETGRAGAPPSVRRTASDDGRGSGTDGDVGRSTAEASPEESGTSGAGTGGAPRRERRPTSGRPDTVRKVEPQDPDDPGQDAEQAAGSARGGRMMIGGEDITRSMISAKKAQLARVKNDQVVGKKGKGSKKSDEKRSGRTSKKDGAGGKKSGKKSKK